jgi:WD40 repeat protein
VSQILGPAKDCECHFRNYFAWHRTRGELLIGHSGSVNAVALGEVNGEPVVVSGADDEMVRLWDAHTGQPRAVAGCGVTSSLRLLHWCLLLDPK